MKIIKEKIVFNDKLVIQEGQIQDNNNNIFSRLSIKREDASAILIVNTDSNKVILTRQFRYAISSKIEEQILEIVAGKIDEGEEPLTTAIRETEEETGYQIKPGQIQLLLSCFVSPGYSSERIYIYYANVTDTDKIAKGGGLESENEFIDVVEMDINEFKKQIQERLIQDAKTYIAGLHLLSLHSKLKL